MEAGAGHPAFYVFVLHELFPHKTGAMIFRHQHGDSEIEAEHVRVVPICERIERIAVAVLRPHLLAIRTVNMAQHADAILEQKWKRAARRAWNDAAVHGTKRTPFDRGAAPRGVAIDVIGCADAPEIFTVIGKAIAKGKAETFVGFSGFHGIVKIICVSVAFVAEVKPSVRILMGENGIVSGNVFDSLILDFWTRPG